MAFPSQEQIDIIATKILFDTKEALLMLKAWNNSIADGATKLKLFKELIKATAAQMNGDMVGATASVKKFASALEVNPAVVKRLGDEMKTAGGVGSAAFQRVFTSVNALRIALGALTSMILFNVIQGIQQLASDSIKQFTEMEDSLWRLVNVERELSKQGTEISMSGLKKGIEDIRKLLPIFSEQDIAGLVGKVAISTKELGFTEEQILDLAKAISILNVRSTENEDLNQTASKVITALLSGTTKGVSTLGVALSDTIIKTKAMELGLLKATDSLDKLSTEQKAFVKLQVILSGTSGELSSISGYLDTNAAKVRENSAAWDDFKAAVGGFTSTLIPALTETLKFLTGAVNMVKTLAILFEVAKASVANFYQAITTGASALDAVRKGVLSLKDIPKIFDEIASKSVKNMFAKMPTDAPEWFKNLFGKYLTDVETATDATAKFKDELANDEEAQKALDDLDKQLQEIILDAKQAQEDLDLKLKQKRADLDTEYQRKEADAARNHAQKLEDINKDALQKIDDAKRKSREDEKKAEEDLLQKLKELRERFLLDLEEALHNRDARQVLRLIKEYQLDKQNLLDRKKLDDQQRKDTLAADLEAIETERRRKIEAENIEYKRKLADLAIAKAREEEELNLWYKREQEDIRRNIEEKLQKLINGYISEGKIHESNQAAIYNILKKYLGKDMGLVDSLATYMAQRFKDIQAMAQQSILTSPYALSPATVASLTGSGSMQTTTSGGGSVLKRAEGGTVIATRPTTAIFGERGAEMATFTPLGRTGRDVNKVFGDISGAGANGQIYVNVDLSPDLEARVIQRSADHVGNVISRVNNRKV